MPQDIYTQWLGLPPGPRPPTPHALLGLKPGVRDRAAIDRAAAARMDRLDQYVLSGDPQVREQVQQLMNEVARARTQVIESLPPASEPRQPAKTPAPRVRVAGQTPPNPSRSTTPPSRRRGKPVNFTRRAHRAPRPHVWLWSLLLVGWSASLVLTVVITSALMSGGASDSPATDGVSAIENAGPANEQDAGPQDSAPIDPGPAPDPVAEARDPALQAYIDRRDRLEAEAQAELIRQTLSEYNGGITIGMQHSVNRLGELIGIMLVETVGGDRPDENHLITDLSPLAGLRLQNLELKGLDRLESIEPLRGMPLSRLHILSCPALQDLSPLEDVPLTNVRIEAIPATDFSCLRGMPVKRLYLVECLGLDTLEPLRGMPLLSLYLDGSPFVTDLSPIAGAKLETLSLIGTAVDDLTVLRGMPLHSLYLDQCVELTDLSGVSGMSLRRIGLAGSGVVDLVPLRGMPITSITLENCPNLRSLDGLEGVTLDYLFCSNCPELEDVSALTHMWIKEAIHLNNTNISALPALAGVSFGSLYLTGCTRITSLDGLQGVTLELLNCEGCEKLEDIAALAEATITRSINLSGTAVRDISPLRDSACVRVWLDDCEYLESLFSIWEMPNVQTIYFRNSNLTREEVNRDRYNNPNRRAGNIRLVDR